MIVVQAMIIVTSASVDMCHPCLKADDELKRDRYGPNNEGAEHYHCEYG